MARKKKLPEIPLTCLACGKETGLSEMLRLGDAHADTCSARPVLLRLDSDSQGRWVPIIHHPDNMTAPDKDHIREQIKEMIADFESRS